MGYNRSAMARYYEIARALRHHLRLHFANPSLSKCMLVSILLVIATAGPLSRAQQGLSRRQSATDNIAVVIQVFFTK